ncbi:MAG TPA: N-methyl-L-tryptophan oxidase [Candidatus Limnocylindrales bacterium]|nr:N-methyl-L-tryptophan oxidase [Candidatus Limnocylindrales bacterium]
MQREWDVVVVGLGGIGSAAAHWAAARPGTRVLGLEQFELDHPNGASRDHSRIIRLSYHRPDYVRLARRAYAAWAEVEVASGARIVTKTGGIDIFPPGGATDRADYTGSLDAEGVPYELLDAAEAMRRWPQWRLPDDAAVLFQAESGIADPNRGNPAHRALATANGATLLERTPVVAVQGIGGDEYLVTTADGTVHRAGRVVLATDAWTNRLLAGLGRQLPLTVTREQVTYFACPDPAAFAPDRFPIWIWMDEPAFYGFPTYGEAGPKAAQDVGGRVIELADRTFEVDAEAHARLVAFLERHLPGAVGPDILTKTCIYTLTPERDFVVDRLPDHPGVVLALGAGHGYKFASVLGRILVELALDGDSPSAGEIEAFRVDRSVLLESNPASSFRI